VLPIPPQSTNHYASHPAADIFPSSFGRVYYLARPNGTNTCDKAEPLCLGLWPQGAWQQVSYASKEQQLEVERYYRAQSPALDQ
jgi:hypothetical protein